MISTSFFDETMATCASHIGKRPAETKSQCSVCDSEESTAASDGDSPKTLCMFDGDSFGGPCNEEEHGCQFRVWAHDKFREGEFQRRALLDALQGHVAVLAFHAHGSRVLQDALEGASHADCLTIAGELQGFACQAVASPHASHVLEKLLLLSPPAGADLLFKELVKIAPEIARDRRGCRVLCSVLQHYGPGFEGMLEAVVRALLDDAAELSRHPFGHHVVEAVLVHGADRHRQHVVAALRGRIARGARNRSASYVVQRALRVCAAAERDAVAGELLGKPQNMLALARSQFGCHVLRTLLEFEGPHATLVLEQLAACGLDLQASRYGAQLLEDIGFRVQDITA